MSIFDFPRINFLGTIQLNPGTANNDDYAQELKMPASWGPYAGQPFGLIDSKLVEPRTFGMSDADFVAWVQKPYVFDGSPKPVMPSEWNYYGDMSSSALASVIGVQTGPGQSYTAKDASVPLSALIGAELVFSGCITDVNSEGSPPATQFFIDNMWLASGGKTIVQGAPSKGACQWINFYRNVNLVADGGAGGYIYHVLLAGPSAHIDIPGFPPNARGLVFRYYLYNTQQGVTDNSQLAALYSQGKTNPATLQIVGTLAPLMPDETILTGPVGRLLTSDPTPISVPPNTRSNAQGGKIALAPAVVQQNGTIVSADFLGTFPDWYRPLDASNLKYDFGPVSLVVSGSGTNATIGTVPYADTGGGNALGWVFDFDIAANAKAQQALQDPEAAFTLVSDSYGTVLTETEYYFPSNQQGVYLEQYGPGDQFLNQGITEPATVSVYHRGKELDAASCPPITVWGYQSTPLQSPGNAFVVSTTFKPGDALVADTSQPGNLLFTFTIGGPNPPENYNDFANPPWITNAPSISVRILPNKDYSQYYVDAKAADPVGNAQLTWDVVYAEVLRTYYLLYPAMNQYIKLNSEDAVSAAASAILYVTEMSNWMTSGYMPRTRDMSATRKQLLRAWCHKVSPPPSSTTTSS